MDDTPIKETDDELMSKTLTELEVEHGIEGETKDLPAHYLGVPPSSYYKEAEIDFEATRVEFDAVAKRLGFKKDVQ